MKNHHISEAGVSFEIQFGLCIKSMGWRTHFLHMAANYRLKILLKSSKDNIFWHFPLVTCPGLVPIIVAAILERLTATIPPM